MRAATAVKVVRLVKVIGYRERATFHVATTEDGGRQWCTVFVGTLKDARVIVRAFQQIGFLNN